MRKTAFACSLLLALVCSVCSAEEPARVSPPVGKYGHPALLVMEGAKTIPAEVVKHALLDDAEVLLAGHPRAPLDDYPHTLRRRAVDGYQREGFPDVRVNVALDEQNERIVMSVSEGPRYTCGEVLVEGARQIDAVKLIERLTQPHPPSGAIPQAFREDGAVKLWVGQDGKAVSLEQPAWKRGEPAPFGFPSQLTFGKLVREALADVGFEAVDFSVRLVPDAATKSAALLISIADEGAQSRIRAIQVAGCEKNSQPAVLDYLELAPGQSFTPALQAQWGHKLWQSGRFLKSKVQPERDAQSGAVDLKIELVEYAHAPPLDAEFSEYEQILLRCRDWLVNLEDSGYDLVINEQFDHLVDTESVRIQVGVTTTGRSGAIITGGAAAEGDETPDRRLPAYGLMLSEKEIALFSTHRGMKLAGQPADGFFHAELSFGLTESGEKINLGFIFNANNQRKRRLISVFGTIRWRLSRSRIWGSRNSSSAMACCRSVRVKAPCRWRWNRGG